MPEPPRSSRRARGQALAIGLAAAGTLPGFVIRLAGVHLSPGTAPLVFGFAIVSAAFLLIALAVFARLTAVPVRAAKA